jgi:hypothetical protein
VVVPWEPRLLELSLWELHPWDEDEISPLPHRHRHHHHDRAIGEQQVVPSQELVGRALQLGERSALGVVSLLV